MSWHHVINVSGGKDSTALLLLAIERGTPNLKVVFADTGNEHPQTYECVRFLEHRLDVPIQWVRASFDDEIAGKREYVATRWAAKGVPAEKIARAMAVLRPTGNPFLDLCLWKGRFPSRMTQFCTAELKKVPINEQVVRPLLFAGHRVISWQGVRAQESPKRALLPMVERQPDGPLWAYRPILHWTAEEVFAMHHRHGIEPNPLYTQGMGRVGCMPCINVRKSELFEIAKRFPEQIDRIEAWEAAVTEASKRGAATFFSGDSAMRSHSLGGFASLTPSEVASVANVRQAVEWSATSRGGRHYDLLKWAERQDDDTPICSSAYGLCE